MSERVFRGREAQAAVMAEDVTEAKFQAAEGAKGAMTDVITLSPAAVAWLTAGEKGISSEALFYWLLLGSRIGPWRPRDYPLDPSDFRRCELLLRAVPEARVRAEGGVMAAMGPVWAALATWWPEITALLEEECPGCYDNPAHYGRAPRTYELMQAVISAAQEKP